MHSSKVHIKMHEDSLRYTGSLDLGENTYTGRIKVMGVTAMVSFDLFK